MTKRGRRKPARPQARPRSAGAAGRQYSTGDQGDPSRTQVTSAPAASSASSIHPVDPWQHIVVWTAGVLAASLLPFLWVYVDPPAGKASPSIYQVLGRGDLYLVAIIILLAGVTEIALLFRHIDSTLTLALLIIGALFIAPLDAARYANASGQPIGVMPSHSVVYWSVAAFVFSAIHSSTCVKLAAGVR